MDETTELTFLKNSYFRLYDLFLIKLNFYPVPTWCHRCRCYHLTMTETAKVLGVLYFDE